MRLAYVQANGVVAVVHAAEKSAVERVLGPLTDDEYRGHVVAVSIPVGVAHFELPADWVPPDRDFRNAWRVKNGRQVAVDMSAARSVWRDKLRADRTEKLTSLDVEFQRAIEVGGDTKEIVRRKQSLRDCTKHPAIDAAKTPDELKALTLEVLTG